MESGIVGYLAAPWFPQSPGCSSSSLSPGCSEVTEAPSPAGPSLHPLNGSSPAARGSSSLTGSSTWPSRCGSSAVSLLCLTLRAGGRWPLPAVNQITGSEWDVGFNVLSSTSFRPSVCLDCIPDSAAGQSCHLRPESSGWSSSYLQVAPLKLTLEKKPKGKWLDKDYFLGPF